MYIDSIFSIFNTGVVMTSTGCLKKLASFHKLISMQISVNISSHLDSMFLNRSTFVV